MFGIFTTPVVNWSLIEKKEREKYDYPALEQEYKDTCPADFPWMKKTECATLAKLWAWQAGAVTETPEIEYDNEMFATRDRARADGRLDQDKTGFETYHKNHPIVKSQE